MVKVWCAETEWTEDGGYDSRGVHGGTCLAQEFAEYITRVPYGRVNMMSVHAARLTIVDLQTGYTIPLVR